MKSIIYVDMDDVICDFSAAYHSHKETFPEIAYPQSIKNFFRNMAPMEGAIDAVTLFRNSDDIDVYVLTAPSTRNPLSYTEKRIWIEQNFDYEFTKNLIICSNKGLLRGDILIDDYQSGKGQENFEGEFIHFGAAEYPSWKSVLIKLDRYG